jgi:hypothetical protein
MVSLALMPWIVMLIRSLVYPEASTPMLQHRHNCGAVRAEHEFNTLRLAFGQA